MAEYSALHAKWQYELDELARVSPLAVKPAGVPLAAPSTSVPALPLFALLPLASVHWVFARRSALARDAARACLSEPFPDTRLGWLKKLQVMLRLWLLGLRGAD